jgi:hypothetical protein
MPQNVSAYMRNGVMVDAYTREVTKNISSQVAKTAVGSGAAAINAAAVSANRASSVETNKTSI